MRLLAAILVALATLIPLEAAAARRLALVIGNDAYENVAKLEKAVNDAAAIARTLRGAGFEVTEAADLTRREMNSTVSAFVSSLAEGDTAMLFYAGHGVAIDNRNYLLPVDVPDTDTADSGFIQGESLALNDIIDRMKARGTRLNLLVVDACRNNPFSGRATRSLGADKGLVRVTAPQGTFVIFSADDGEAALDRLSNDDANPNSVFTRELIPLMRQPGLDLVDMAREVRRRVNTLARSVKHDQTPAYYDAMLGDFRFSEGAADTKLPEQKEEEVASLSPEPDVPTREEPAAAPLAGRALIVTAGEKDSLRLWDAQKASLVAQLEGVKFRPTALRILKGGGRLAVATDDHAVTFYDLPSFSESGSFDAGFRVTSIAQAPDGLLLGGEDGSLSLVDIATFKTRWKAKPHGGLVSPIVVNAEGNAVITASADGAIAGTDLQTGKLFRRIEALPGKSPTDFAFLSPSVIAVVYEDGTIAQVSGKDGRILTSFKAHDGWISSVEVLGDGDYVTAGVDGTLSFWTVGSERPIRIVKAHSDVASGAKLMRFGGTSHMISAGFDGSLKIWDPQVRELQAELPHGAAILFFDYLPQG